MFTSLNKSSYLIQIVSEFDVKLPLTIFTDLLFSKTVFDSESPVLIFGPCISCMIATFLFDDFIQLITFS